MLRCYDLHSQLVHTFMTNVIQYITQQCQSYVEQQQLIEASDDTQNKYQTLFEWHQYDQYETLLLRLCSALKPTDSLLQQQLYLQILQHFPPTPTKTPYTIFC